MRSRLTAFAVRARFPVPPVLALLAAASVLAVLIWPERFPLLSAGLAAGLALLLAYAFPTLAAMVWLLAVGLTPDMWLVDLGGDVNTALAVIAALKFTGLGLVALAMLRFGAVWDGFNPGFAFAAMFTIGLLHGLHPNLSWAESARSLLGSAAPYAFCFVRLPPHFRRGLMLTVMCIPAASVLLGMGLAASGIRPVFIDAVGLRLQGAGHPAFLGGFALAACEAALLELLRGGRLRHAAWLAVNFAILLASGARAPLVIAVAVTGLALLFAPAPRLNGQLRLGLLLLGAGAATAAAIAIGAAGDGMLSQLRFFQLLGGEADYLSGRDEIWPLFQAAWDGSPWWGWGVGAGKVLVDPDSPLARLLGTTAAHNEYLRIGVEGGYIGLGLLVLFSIVWSLRHLGFLRGPDRWVMALVLIGFAVHSATDNTLIATTSSVLFAWVAAVFARGEATGMRPERY